MFSNISWQEYWTLLVAITLVYYIVVYLVYFRNGSSLSSPKQVFNLDTSANGDNQPTLFEVDNPGIKQTMKESEEYIIEACIDELNAFFENGKKTKAIKHELMFGLFTILQKYPSLRSSDYKESLTNLIATQCENICSIHLSAEELKGVWFG
ncbi:MAG TPA: hypothetical protein VNT20_21445 [Flavisolibacter sp.]|jgi:hypothetical protein|nr:hypothetical protein [Flavisolibacter sp.]